jgi:hypothetical protein
MARIREGENVYRILVGKSLKRSRRRQKNDIKMYTIGGE